MIKILVLAGGFATRLYPLTLNKAKALLEFKGKPVITHVINRVPQDTEVLISVNKRFARDFEAWKKTVNRQVKLCIENAESDGQKMGAVGAIDYWIRNLNITEDLIIIAADNYFESDLSDLIAFFNGKNTLIAVYDVGDKEKACRINEACQVGLVILEGDRVIRLDEKPPRATSSIVATGIYVLPARIFPILSRYCREEKRDNLGGFIRYLLIKEPVYAYTLSGFWTDIGDAILKQKGAVPDS